MTDLTNAEGPFSNCSQTFLPAHAPPFSEVQGSYLACSLAMHGTQQHHSSPLQTRLFFFLTRREEKEQKDKSSQVCTAFSITFQGT